MKENHPNVVNENVDLIKLVSILIRFVKSAKRHLVMGSVLGVTRIDFLFVQRAGV